MRTEQFDTTVLGGLPVTIEYVVYPADPSVGLFQPYTEEWQFVAVKGKSLKDYNWIYKRLTPKQEEEIMEKCNANIN